MNRRALPIPDHHRPDLPTGYHAPADDLENAIAAIWKQILQMQTVGTEDNFFELGGHSLLMVQLHSAIRRTFSSDISMMDLFRYPVNQIVCSCQ